MNEETPRWLSAKEAAAYMSISRSTFFRLVEEGKIPEPKKIGDRIKRYDRTKIDDMMEGQNE